MAETNPTRLAAIRESHATRKKRKRSAALRITVTEGERDEFRLIAERHGMLDRELLMNAVRAFKTSTQRLDAAEARLTLLEARLDKLEQPQYKMPEEYHREAGTHSWDDDMQKEGAQLQRELIRRGAESVGQPIIDFASLPTKVKQKITSGRTPSDYVPLQNIPIRSELGRQIRRSRKR